jgi:hypothetical protein
MASNEASVWSGVCVDDREALAVSFRARIM